MNGTKYWVWLSMIFGAGSRRIWEAMRLAPHPEDVYEMLASGQLNDRLDENEIRSIASTSVSDAEKFIEDCRKKGIEVISCSDSEYPPQLRHILNPPAVLYYRGNISCLRGARAVASVGARKACSYSLEAASRICGELARNDITIVSGFAMGIDITSHLAAAEIGRPTACVLGCGVDVDYPRENVRFRDKITESGGVFISEYPPGTPPHSFNFPKRNRILAALARAVIVFEASSKSGSLITASLAAAEGREVFVLPPADIFAGRFTGNTVLLRDGAQILLSADDVLECLRVTPTGGWDIYRDMPSEVSYFGVSELSAKGRRKISDKPSAENKKEKKKRGEESPLAEIIKSEIPGTGQKQEPVREYTPVQHRILDAIGDDEVHADIIIQKAGLTSSEFMLEMTELEISGAIKSLPGKVYAKGSP
ncbi:MAG: DNA-protecting protein DprA [Ruminococcus sp.]|nr:DNA-protecting protein DprA [Ruminococcus sp.]